MKETFKDYADNPKGLIGKRVLYKSRYSTRLSVISGVKKLHFTLETIPGNFRLIDGSEEAAFAQISSQSIIVLPFE